MEATPQLAAALQAILAQVLALSTARRSPIDLLVFLEVGGACTCCLHLLHRLAALTCCTHPPPH